MLVHINIGIIPVLIVISNTVWCGGHAHFAKPLIHIRYRYIRILYPYIYFVMFITGIAVFSGIAFFSIFAVFVFMSGAKATTRLAGTY